MPKFELNKKYQVRGDDREDWYIIREDRYSYYIVDSLSIVLCGKSKGLDPVFEVEKNYDIEGIEDKIVRFLLTQGIDVCNYNY